MTLGRLLLASSSTAAIILAVPAVACAQAAAATPSADAQGSGSVAEVVVTAQKREQRLQDVPISIEVVSAQKLSDFHATDFKSIMNYTPNVFVESTAGDDVIYIRGFGSPPANFAFDQSVSLYLDGVYAGRSRQAQSPFFDLQRVEVLRGPQGALFGKNTPAGAVSVVSAGPTSTLQGSATAEYNFDLKGYDVSGFISGPINQDWSFRLAARFLDEDGYLHNTFSNHDDPEQEQKLARLTLKYAPTGPFDYTIKAELDHSVVTGGMNVSAPLDQPQDPKTTRYTDSTTPFSHEGTKADSLLVSGTGNLKIGDFTLTSVTGYSFFHSDIVNEFDQAIPGGGITPNTVYNSFPEHFRQLSQEVRLLSPSGRRFEYVVGAYYDNAYYRLDQLQGFNDLNLGPTLPFYQGYENTFFRQRSQTVSAFGQGTLHLTDRLRLVGSVRYTETDKRAYFGGRLLQGFFPLQALTNAAGINNGNNIDPSLTLQYDLAPHVMVYATYGRGSKSGGFVSNTFGTTSDTFSFKPEQSQNYEGGVKSTFLGGRLVLNASIYDTKFYDLQVSVFDPATQGYLTGNAASASSKGVEASATWAPLPNLDFSASGAYQDVSYDNYPGAACLATESVAKCDPTNPVSVKANNIKGAVLAYTSKFTGSFQAHYRYEVGSEYALDTTVNVAGRSKYFDSDNEDPLFGLQPGYAKVDLRIQFAPKDERWHVALVGKNLTDELTTGSAFDLPVPITANARAILYVEQGRNIALEAGVKF